MAKSEVDVLIIGAGPAGLMLALWLSRLGVTTRIVDKRTAKVFSGQADGFQVRTMEILDSFGIGERVWKEANHMMEVIFWNPDEQGVIRRSSRVPDVKPGLSRFTQAVLHQGRMEQFFLDAIKESYESETSSTGTTSTTAIASRGKEDIENNDLFNPSNAIKVERCTLPMSLTVDPALGADHQAHAVTVTLRHLTEEEATPTQRLSNLSDGIFRSNLVDDDVEGLLGVSGARLKKRKGVEASEGEEKGDEVVKARYVVGCDGAHSWTRQALGKEFEMVGEMTDYIWGVLDIVPITDFPDIRNRCMVHSPSSGSLMVIPRENKLVRLYIQLTEADATGERLDKSKITPDFILKAAQKILSPYKLEYHYFDWWTAYQIGQRVGKRFSMGDRVFLAGDAVHTHSPKAGQGMNVSMQDTYNLGWKLGLACRGILKPSVLSTYELERKQIAEELIAFDQKFARLFSGRPAKDVMDETGVSMEEFERAFELSHMFTTGVGINYQTSPIVSKDKPTTTDSDSPNPETTTLPETSSSTTTTKPPTSLIAGTRLPSSLFLSQPSARPWQLHHLLPSDGRFKLLLFTANITSPPQLSTINNYGAWLREELLPLYPRVHLSPGSSPHTGTLKFRPSSAPSIVDVFLIHSAARESVELSSLDEAFRNFDPKTGWDYDRVLVDSAGYHEGTGGVVSSVYGIDPDGEGVVVVVRPDGYVGLVIGVGEAEGKDRLKGWLDGILCRV